MYYKDKTVSSLSCWLVNMRVCPGLYLYEAPFTETEISIWRNFLNWLYQKFSFFNLLAFHAEGAFSLPVSVRLSVRPPVRPSVCWSVCPSVRKRYLVRMITRHKVELESPNLHQTCIIEYSQLVLKMGSLTLTFKVILAILTQNSKKFACPCDNSSQIWAEITKFAPNMQLWILSAGIENGGHWPWPSMSFWLFSLRIPRNGVQHRSCILIEASQGVLHVPNVLLVTTSCGAYDDMLHFRFSVYIGYIIQWISRDLSKKNKQLWLFKERLSIQNNTMNIEI